MKKWNSLVKSLIDTDTRTGYKSEDISFFEYNNRVAMNTDRPIVGEPVTSKEKHDEKQTGKLIEK